MTPEMKFLGVAALTVGGLALGYVVGADIAAHQALSFQQLTTLFDYQPTHGGLHGSQMDREHDYSLGGSIALGGLGFFGGTALALRQPRKNR